MLHKLPSEEVDRLIPAICNPKGKYKKPLFLTGGGLMQHPDVEKSSTPTRPHHGPRQIRTLKSLRAGLRVVRRSKDMREVVTLTSGPQQAWWGGWYVTYGEGEMLFLSDFSVLPYVDETWNTRYWLERAR